MKLKLIITLVAVATVTILSSCLKPKDYNCECTYVPEFNGARAGEPNKVENTTVKGRLLEDAKMECEGLSSKYLFDEYSHGTCLIK